VIEDSTHTPRRLIPDATLDLILATVSNGASLLTACENAGISRQSFYRWLDADPELVGDYAAAVSRQVHSRFSQ
jgi:hypothetical protein